ncbi:Replication protein A 70 kDa DNA-binding subunit, partial [Bienertia sinuspersici]
TGETTIPNSLLATKILVNEAIPKVHEFKKSICNEVGGDSQRLTHLSRQGSHSISDEFLTFSEKMQLDEICETAKECFCATYATIVGINNNMLYYDSCKQCNKKVEYEGGGKYWCTKCDLHFKSTPKRYKVTVTVPDDSGSATFVIIDRENFQVLQISAMNLRDVLNKDPTAVIAYNEDSSICFISPTKKSFKDSPNDGKMGKQKKAIIKIEKDSAFVT